MCFSLDHCLPGCRTGHPRRLGQGRASGTQKSGKQKEKKKQQKIKTRKQKESAGGHHLPTSAVEGSQALPLWSCT